METYFTWEITDDVLKSKSKFKSIQIFLQKWLRSKAYGNGIKNIHISLNCTGPLAGDSTPFKDFKTGCVLLKKYTKSTNSFLLHMKINYKEFKRRNVDYFSIIVRPLLYSLHKELTEIDIPNFDAEFFAKDIDELFNKKLWLDDTYSNTHKHIDDNKYAHDVQKENHVIKFDLMPMDDFWHHIGFIKSNDSKYDANLLDYIITPLSKLAFSKIVGFELTLRNIIANLNNEKVKNCYKQSDNIVMDDAFLTFRCSIIFAGEQHVVDLIDRDIACSESYIRLVCDYDDFSENILSVADKAYLKKYNNNTFDMLPSAYGERYYDYNLDVWVKNNAL